MEAVSAARTPRFTPASARSQRHRKLRGAGRPDRCRARRSPRQRRISTPARRRPGRRLPPARASPVADPDRLPVLRRGPPPTSAPRQRPLDDRRGCPRSAPDTRPDGAARGDRAAGGEHRRGEPAAHLRVRRVGLVPSRPARRRPSARPLPRRPAAAVAAELDLTGGRGLGGRGGGKHAGLRRDDRRPACPSGCPRPTLCPGRGRRDRSGATGASPVGVADERSLRQLPARGS